MKRRFCLAGVGVLVLILASCALAQIPANPTDWEQKARSLSGTHLWPTDRKVKELREFCQQTLAGSPSAEVRALAERWLGEAYIWNEDDPGSPGDAGKAIAQFNRVIALFPESEQAAWARFGLGEVNRIHGKFDQALAIYAGLLKARVPDALRPWIALREASAFAHKNKDTKDPAVAEKFRAVAGAFPGTEAAARALVYCAGNLAELGRFDDACAQYATLLKDYGQIAFRVELARAHQQLAVMAQRDGNLAAATRHWQAIIEQFPDSRFTLDAFYHIARRFTSLAKTREEAIAVIEPHSTTGPPMKQAAALVVLELLHRESGLTAKAAAARSRLASEFPASHDTDELALGVMKCASEYWYHKVRNKHTYTHGAVLAENGLLLNAGLRWQSRLKFFAAENWRLAEEYAAALQWYDRIKNDDPNWQDIPLVLAGSAECKRKTGDLQGAVALLERAASLEKRPGEKAEFLVRGAGLCREVNLFDKGIAMIEALDNQVGIDTFPGLAPRARFTLAFLCGEKGDLGRAAAEFQRLLDLYPGANERPQAMLQKGICLQALGDASGAASSYQALLASYPADVACIEAKRRLTALGASQ
jgi:tetratricopeptide (TPR) repeat protein